MYLLDTNVISEMRKIGDGKAHPNVVAWQADIDPEHFYLSPVTVMELRLGILRLVQRRSKQGEVISHWFEQVVLPQFRGRILPIDTQVAMRCAGLHATQTRPYNDAWIAATALVHGMTVVTRNVADFERTGLLLLNPWEPQTP